MKELKRNESSENQPKLAAFIDNDNIHKGIKKQYENTKGYDIEKLVEFLQDEGDLRFGRVYLNPGDFQGKQGLLHKFNMDLLRPVYTDTYRYKDDNKSLADTNIIWDISETYHKRPEIEKYAIVSGDKDFLPVIRRLHEKGKDGVLMWVDGEEAKDLRKTANKIGWETYTVPPYKGASNR